MAETPGAAPEGPGDRGTGVRGPRDGGPRDAGERAGGPRDAGERAGGPRDADGGPHDLGPDGLRPPAPAADAPLRDDLRRRVAALLDAPAAPAAPVAPVEPAASGAPTAPAIPTRRLLGIAGAPGAGKSTLSAQILAAFPGRCVVVPMDGFHLAQTELERLGRADRKGAPDTFDAAGYVALLRRLRAPVAGETVYAPEYRRDLRNGVAGAIGVPADVPLVVTEGNYLLLDQDGFAPVRDLLDACWFVDLPEEVRAERLVARHELFGKPPAAAYAWTHGPDQRNADLVAATRTRADVVVTVD